MSIKRTEIIDAYLRNELNAEDTQAFESELAGDPTLQDELGFQQQVVKGLGEFRKAQLKSRLTAINITAPWWQVGQIVNPALVKVAGVVMTAAFVGSGIFYFNNQNETTDFSDAPTVFEEDLVSNIQQNYHQSIFEATDESAPKALARLESAREDIDNDFEAGSVTTTVNTELSAPAVQSKSASTTSMEDFIPDVALPNPGDGTEKVQFKSESAEMPLASKVDIINASEQIDIKTSQRNNEEIRYKYYEGKLHLYGNFKENPYEILEINSTNKRQVYLYHSGKYFKLLTTDKVLELPQISDRLLIQELEIVRNNKVD